MSRRYYYILALVFLVGIVALDLAFFLRPDHLKTLIDAEIRKNLKAGYRYDNIGFSGDTIIVENVELYRPENPDEFALTCERVGIEIDLAALLGGEIKVKRIAIEQPVVFLKWNEDGELDLASLVKSSDTKSRAPTIPILEINKLQLEFVNAPFFDDSRQINIGHIDLELSPRFSDAFSYGFSGRIVDKTFGRLDLNGSFGAALFRGSARCQGFRITPELTGLFRKDLREALEPLRMTGGLDLELDVASQELLQGVDLKLTASTKGLGLGWGDESDFIKNLEGAFVFEGQRFESQYLQFELGGAPVRVEEFRVDFPKTLEDRAVDANDSGGDLAQPSADEPSFFLRAIVDKLRLDAKFAAALQVLPKPFPEIAETILAFGCDGFVDMSCTLSRDPLKQPNPELRRVEVDCAIDLQEMTMVWRGYADEVTGEREGYDFPINRLVGRIDLTNDGLVTEGLRSLAEDQDAVIKGFVDFGRKPLAYDVIFDAREIELDERVLKALHPNERAIYDQVAPEGQFDFELLVRHQANAVEEGAEVRVKLGLHLDSALVELFPLPLQNVEGTVVLAKNQPAVFDIKAASGPVQLSFDGQLNLGNENKDSEFTFDAQATDLELSPELLDALRPQFSKLAQELTRYQLSGLVDLKASFESADPSSNQIDISLKGVDFRIPELAEVAMTNFRGELRSIGQKLTVVSGEFEAFDNKFLPSGWIEFGDNPKWDLRVVGSRNVVDDRLMRFAASFSEELDDFGGQFAASGTVGLDVRLRRSSVGELITTRVVPVGVSFRHRTKPLEIGNLHGVFEVRGKHLRIEKLSADLIGGRGPSPVPVKVTLDHANYTLADGLHLKGLQLLGLPLGESTQSWAPEGLANFLREYSVDGHVDANLSVLRLKDSRAVFRGSIHPRILRAEVGIPIEFSGGVLELKSGVVTAEGLQSLQGRLKRSQGKLQRFAFEKMAADVVFEKNEFRISDIDTRLIGGRTNPAETRFNVQLGDVNAFDLGLRLGEGDLSTLVTTFGGQAKSLQGRANLVMGLSGQFGELQSYRGEARIKMRGDRLYELPFFAPIFQLINFDFLTSPTRGAQRGEIFAVIGDQEVAVRKATFRGPGINLDGGGTIGFDGICQLAFEPKAIKLLDSIPLISDISDLIGGLIVDKVYLTGPIEDLNASVGNYLTEILPSEPDSGRRPVIRPPREESKPKPQPKPKPNSVPKQKQNQPKPTKP